MNPLARRSGLLIRELPDELLVYDETQHRAHCLNRTAALVFRNADGSRSLDELALVLAAGAEREVVVEALAQLEAAGLLVTAASADDAPRQLGVGRRDAMRRMSVAAAVLLPAVVSIVAPTPAEAAVTTCVADCTGQPAGTPCDHCGNGIGCPSVSTCDGAGNCSDGCV